jgi:N-acetylmuramoyl-L-alanine amidase
MVKVQTLKFMLLLPLLLIGLMITPNPKIDTLAVHGIDLANAMKVDAKQLQCLATNIYHEARKEPLLGQYAVARVVMNRVKQGFANTPCKVIYQKTSPDKGKTQVCQFSWVCEKKPLPPPNSPDYMKAMQIAYDVLAHDSHNDILPRSAVFFHALHVDPMWPYKKVKQIGNHIFYRK